MPSNAKHEKVYGVADKAWQCVVGCDPHMPCAPRCWARKTVARVVECQKVQHPARAEFFQVTLAPDGSKWSGEVRLDEAHLTDPLKWRKPAVVATGFHGDWGRLNREDMAKVLGVMAHCRHHRFVPLTKQPHHIADFLANHPKTMAEDAAEAIVGRAVRFSPIWIPDNINFGCSVMNQAEADKYREPMAQIAALGWNTHVWYEPAIGAVDWTGWEFLRGMISGGESGINSRPSHPQWCRDTRDWCVANRVPFNFKQWGDWLPDDQNPQMQGQRGISGAIRVGKKLAGRLLDGVTHDAVPAFGEARG